MLSNLPHKFCLDFYILIWKVFKLLHRNAKIIHKKIKKLKWNKNILEPRVEIKASSPVCFLPQVQTELWA